jgi:flavin-dependent dehydrogenase
VVARRTFDQLLLDEYLKLGGRLLKDRVREVREREDGSIEVTLGSGETVRCRYLVGADGANSRVRQYLNPASKPRVLIFEQYNQRSGTDEITFELANKYKNGYYYLFPNRDHDIHGYCELDTSREKFASVLEAFGVEKTKTLGAFITTEIDYPFHPRILLVGDAGCWCDCLSYEGIYFALATGENAARAILENRPFEEVNAPILAKKLHRNKAAKLLYNPVGLAMVKLISRHPDRTERILNRYLQ